MSELETPSLRDEKKEEKTIEDEFPLSSEFYENFGITPDGKTVVSTDEASWATPPVYIKERLGAFFDGRPDLVDMYFVCGDGKGETQRFGAHRLIVAASSPILEAMVYPAADGKESKESEDILEIKINAKPELFKIFLDCLYTDDAPVGPGNFTALMDLGQKYYVEKLLRLCADYLASTVTAETVCDILQIAPQLIAESEVGRKLIEEHTGEVIASKSFLSISKETLKVILSNDRLNISELDLYTSLIKWGEAESKRKRTTQKACVREFIHLIRFPHMSTAEVSAVVAKSNYVTDEELLAIFQYVTINDEDKRSRIKMPFSTAPRAQSAKILVAPSESSPYTSSNGAFNWIGTRGGTKPWENPHRANLLIMSAEGAWSGSGFHESNLVDSIESGRNLSQDVNMSGTWFQVDLLEWRVDVSHYSLKNGGGRGLVLEHWNFEAKVNASDPWEILREHRNDRSFADDNQKGFGLHVFEIKKKASVGKFYRYFRINRTDSKRNIYAHRWELYGKIKKARGSGVSSRATGELPITKPPLFRTFS